VLALLGPFRNGGASALFRLRRTVCPLLSLCRTSRDKASRYARLSPFEVGRSRAIPPTPPSTSWRSVPAGAQPVARVFPPPGLDPATAGGTGGAAPPAVGAAPRLPSATAGADTAAATSQTGGTPTTAGGCASLPEAAATTGVDAVALAKSGAALGGGDAIEVDEAAPTSSKNARTDRRPHLAGVRSASELGVEELVRRLHACRVRYALASGKTPPPNPPLLADRCVLYKPRGAAAFGARRATSDERSAGGAGSVVPTLVAAAPVGRGSAIDAEAGAGAGGAPGKSAPVAGGPPSDTESYKSGRTRARDKRAAGARRGAMPRPTMSKLGGAGGGDDREWNQSSGGSMASSSTGRAPTPQHQGRRASGGPRLGGVAGAEKKGPGNGKGKMWTVDEQVALWEAFKLVAQRTDMGADWSKEGLWDFIKEDFVQRIPKILKPSDLKGRWSERTAGSMQTHFCARERARRAALRSFFQGGVRQEAADGGAD